MTHVFRIYHTLFLMCNRALFSEMSQHLSQPGSLPYPSSATHSHYQPCPILTHEMEEATHDSHDLSLGSIVEWARKQQHAPPPPR